MGRPTGRPTGMGVDPRMAADALESAAAGAAVAGGGGAAGEAASPRRLSTTTGRVTGVCRTRCLALKL